MRCRWQRMPTFQAAGESFTPFVERSRLIARCWNTAIDKWFRGAVDLGNCYLHPGLDWVKAGLGIAPRLNCLCIQTDSRSVRHIHFAQEVRRCLAIVHCWTTHKTETS